MSDIDLEPGEDELAGVIADVVDDWRDRRAAGEDPDPEEYAAQHPKAAEAIRRVIGRLRLLPGQLALRGEPPHQILGDFRLLHEVGRGGMGVVYQAEQISLCRRVALKVLPFASMADARQLQRFKAEAVVAATLDHPHVVKVHGVGCERGVHYICMQFVDGCSLAEFIRERRGEKPMPSGLLAQMVTLGSAPTPPTAATHPAGGSPPRATADVVYVRLVARWGEQAAEALEHAHSLGIVHRDVKPGNLLVDGRGALFVADFGLARLGPDSGVTGTGDLLGTPRYMSPEQAQARHNLVDHRSDVYSLGATLYELLTLEPAIGAEDRAEILRGIAETDPTPLRQLDRRIPADLETVVLKCLEKDPARRYQSAKDLADDLRRFLAGEAVKAKRRTLRERLLRWVSRRPRSVAGAVLVVAAVLGGYAAWERDQSRTEAVAREAVAQADELRARGRLPESEAVARRAVALLPRFGSDPALRRKALELVADVTLLRRLDEARLLRINTDIDATGVDERPAREAFAAAFRDEYGVDILNGDELAVIEALRGRAIRAVLVAALDDWAYGAGDDAEAKRLSGLADALDSDPGGIAARWRRGSTLHTRHLILEAERDPPPAPFLVRLAEDVIAADDWEAGLRLLRLAQRRHPDDVWVLLTLAHHLVKAGPEYATEALRYTTAAHSLSPSSPVVLCSLGYLLNRLGRHGEAEDYLRMAERLAPDAFTIRLNLGVSLASTGRHTEASREFRRAAELRPDDSRGWHNLGLSLRESGQYKQAVEPLHRGIALCPDTQVYAALSECLANLGQWENAETAARNAVKLNPDNPEAHFRHGLALLHFERFPEAAAALRWSALLRPEAVTFYNLAQVLSRQGRHTDEVAVLREAIRRNLNFLDAHRQLGLVLVQMEDWDRAAAAFREAIRLDPADPDHRANLGCALNGKGNLAAAVAEFREAIRIRPDHTGAHYNLGNTLKAQGDLAGAIAAYREAIRIQPSHAESHCNLGSALRQKGEYAESLAEYRLGHELGMKTAGWEKKYSSGKWLADAKQLAELEKTLWAVLAGNRTPASGEEAVELANMCLVKGLDAGAVRCYGEALRLKPDWVKRNVGGYRYEAALIAARAGCGQSRDAASLDSARRETLRRQSLAWLAAELALWSRNADRPTVRPELHRALREWRTHTDLAGLRDEANLKKVPESEQADWRKLWADVWALQVRIGDILQAPPPRPLPR